MGVGEVISAQFSLAIRQNLMGCYQVQKLELPLVGSNSDTDFFFFLPSCGQDEFPSPG